MATSQVEKQGLSEYLSGAGERVEVGANQPIALDREESAFLVTKGNIDIFSVSLGEGGLQGTRSFVCRIDKGQLFFSMTDGEPTRPIGLLAVPGRNTELIEISLSDLKKAASNKHYILEMSTLVDLWITRLFHTISRNLRAPGVYKELEPGRTIDLDEGTYLLNRGGLLWVLVKEGALTLLGRHDLPAVEPGGRVPVCERAWLRIGVRYSSSTATTAELLASGDDLWTALGSFHILVRQAIHSDRVLAREKETEDFVAHGDAEKRFTEKTITRLASVLTREADQLTEVARNQLQAACMLVGKAVGIRVAPPPRTGAGTVGEDPVQSIAGASGFRTREVLLTEKWWRKDNGPLLGFMDEDERPVALLPSGPRKYVLVDPTRADRIPVDETVAEKLKPFARMFYCPFPDRPLTLRDVLKFGLQWARKDIRMMLLMGICSGLVSILVPIVTQFLYDEVIPGEDRFQLLQVAGALVVVALVSGMFLIVQALAQLRIDGWMGAAIQAAIWDRLLKLPVTFFRRFSAGDLVNRALGINEIQSLLSGAAVSTVIGAVFALFNLAVMFWYSRHLALVALVVIVAALVLAAAAFKIQMRYQRPLYSLLGSIQGFVFQIILGISKLRISAAEKRAFYLWADKFARQKELDLKTRNVTNMVVVFSTILPLAGMLAVFSWFSMSDDPAVHTLSTGSFLAFHTAFLAVLAAIWHSLTFLFPVLAVVPLYERTEPILVATPEVTAGRTAIHELRGHIEISHVSFRYTHDGPWVLIDVSLEASPGEFVALVGPSGSGKSTLYRLLLGFETPESGAIYFDGHDLTGLDIRSVRRQMGVVIQSGRLFTGTILSNIVGAARLTLEDAWDAARKCALEEDIRAMPMGMHTVIGEGGSGFSGGQRQRILIARAIAVKPRIMLFDEATSALDNESQAAVGRSLERLQATRIVIAHRLSTIKNADRIYVLMKGEMVESGNYEELMERNGEFARLAKRQIV